MDRALSHALVASGLLTGGLVAGRALRDALFLSQFPAAALPAVMMGSAALSIAGTVGFSRWLSHSGPARAVPLGLVANAALFGAEAAIQLAGLLPGAVLLYLHVTAFGPVLLSGYWSVVNERFDPYTAKRIVSRVGAAGALAGVVGGLAAERVTALLGAGSMLGLLAGLSLAAAAAVRGVGAPEAATAEPRAAAQRIPVAASLRRDPLMAQMAVFMALTALIDALLDYAFKIEAADTWHDTAMLIRFFAVFYVGCGLATFALQAGVGSRVLRRFGIAGALGALPVAVAASGLPAAATGRLWAFVAARSGGQVVSDTLMRPGFELLYTPIPPSLKRPLKIWIDVAARSLGSIAGAGLVLGGLFLVPGLSTSTVAGLAVVGSVLAGIGVLRIHRAYVAQLGSSLRSGRVALSADEIEDATTARTIAETHVGFDRRTLLEQIEAHWRQRRAEKEAPAPVAHSAVASTPAPAPRDPLLDRIEDLVSGDPARARRALHARDAGGGLRGAAVERRLAAHVIPLLADAALRDAAHDFLRRAAVRGVGQLVDALLDPEEPLEVRLALARLLGGVEQRRSLEGLWLALDDADFALRPACAAAAVRLVERRGLSAPPRDAVHERLARELERSDASGEHLEHCFTLLALLHGRETMTSTLAGLNSGSPALRGTALEFLESVLPSGLCATLLARLGVVPKPGSA